MTTKDSIAKTLANQIGDDILAMIYEKLVYGDMRLDRTSSSGEPFPVTVPISIRLSHKELLFLRDERNRARSAAPQPTHYPGCDYCDRMKSTGSTFYPRHFASPLCYSGKRNHCTCDACF